MKRARNKPPSTLVNETGRECTICGLFKEWDEYYKARSKSSGYSGHSVICKKCSLASSKKRQPVFKENLRKTDPYKYRSRRLRNGLLDRARASGNREMYETTPTAVQLEEWLKTTPLVCNYSGEEVTILTMQVDHRIPVNRGGMNTLDNLCIASAHMNMAKGSMTEQEFKSLLSLVQSWSDKGETLLRRLKQGRY